VSHGGIIDGVSDIIVAIQAQCRERLVENHRVIGSVGVVTGRTALAERFMNVRRVEDLLIELIMTLRAKLRRFGDQQIGVCGGVTPMARSTLARRRRSVQHREILGDVFVTLEAEFRGCSGELEAMFG
jgi:hypothetical protein